MLATIGNFAQNKDHESVDSTVLVILSHGQNGKITGWFETSSHKMNLALFEFRVSLKWMLYQWVLIPGTAAVLFYFIFQNQSLGRRGVPEVLPRSATAQPIWTFCINSQNGGAVIDFSFQRKIHDDLLKKKNKTNIYFYQSSFCTYILLLSSGTDSQSVEIEKIIGKFIASKAPALAGKPKLFLFQACRGSKWSYFLCRTLSSKTLFNQFNSMDLK